MKTTGDYLAFPLAHVRMQSLYGIAHNSGEQEREHCVGNRRAHQHKKRYSEA